MLLQFIFSVIFTTIGVFIGDVVISAVSKKQEKRMYATAGGVHKKALSDDGKKNSQTVNVTFFPSDMDVYTWLEERTDRDQLVIQLVRREMDRESEQGTSNAATE